jgi:hypothetical protein
MIVLCPCPPGVCLQPVEGGFEKTYEVLQVLQGGEKKVPLLITLHSALYEPANPSHGEAKMMCFNRSSRK